MSEIKLTISLLDGLFAVCQLPPDTPIPEWVIKGVLYSITRTGEELSLVCCESNVPGSVNCERGWRCFKVKGPLDFSLTGIMASISGALARAGISLFPISTFDTDYFLIKGEKIDAAIQALKDDGHRVEF